MADKLLVLNCGSSSAKFNLFEIKTDMTIVPILQGLIEEIGNPQKSVLKYSYHGKKEKLSKAVIDHKDALLVIFELLNQQGIDKSEIKAVGHRVVHGGEKYSGSVRIDNSVLATIRELIPIAPLHNPPNLMGIEESMLLLPNVPQVAVFDTAFHSTLPESSYRYAVPTTWYKDLGVRKFGFHGTSHMYVAKRSARLLGIAFDKFSGITAHLGNGCSVTKIENGCSVDTSMGFTPLEGVIMGTRSGDIDPALISHVANSMVSDRGLSRGEAYDAVMLALNKDSGLKALTGTNMMQEIGGRAENGDMSAQTAIQIYAYRIAKYIGQFWTTLQGADALIFTAGLGENEGYVRKMILDYLANLEFAIDNDKNQIRGEEVVIAKSMIKPNRPLLAMVIPTDEEIVIGYDTLYLGYLDQPVPLIYPLRNDVF